MQDFDISKVKSVQVDQNRIGDCWFLASLACFAYMYRLYDRCNIKRHISSFYKEMAQRFETIFPQVENHKEWVVNLYDPSRELTTFPVENLFQTTYIDACNINYTEDAWALVMEKAFALYYRLYFHDTIEHGGKPKFALEALSGQDCETFDLADDDQAEAAWKAIYDENGIAIKGFGVAGTSKKGETELQLQGPHAYSVFHAAIICKVQWVKLRNPWGSEHGLYGSKNTDDIINELIQSNLTDYQKLRIGYSQNSRRKDGIFWMPWETFKDFFRRLSFVDMSKC